MMEETIRRTYSEKVGLLYKGHQQIPSGRDYGSTSLDCRRPFRDVAVAISLLRIRVRISTVPGL